MAASQFQPFNGSHFSQMLSGISTAYRNFKTEFMKDVAVATSRFDI